MITTLSDLRREEKEDLLPPERGHPSLPSPHSALSLGVQSTDKFKQQQLNTRALTWDPQQSLRSTTAPLSMTITTAEGLLSFPYFFFLMRIISL